MTEESGPLQGIVVASDVVRDRELLELSLSYVIKIFELAGKGEDDKAITLRYDDKAAGLRHADLQGCQASIARFGFTPSGPLPKITSDWLIRRDREWIVGKREVEIC
ncbi:hypothetical protein SBA3_250026 [Candidatus Sulfopaludibacter sp. SbA3]|nr:hypothetical protein SBA3_250026 [Candidatus Sulfopaludibacter sp. SbA3]